MATARALTSLPTGWRAVHDLRRSGARLAGVDRVLVGPTGVYVVSLAPAWDDLAVATAADAAITVLELLPGLDPDLVVPVLCVGHDDQPPLVVHDVLVCAVSSLFDELIPREPVLRQTEVRALAERLRFAMPTATTWVPRESRAPRVPRASRAKVRHVPWEPYSEASPAVRSALIGIAICLTICPLIWYVVWPLVARLDLWLMTLR